ncbi:uncharacterized protein LOC129222963 [Uloborus diversus]|uniref:uncharacterized protein LOC129222963 n=1 Tax=Uloborus diversus TaxID=327109 RepID=UPI002409F3A9|nr:uncharacterized protein LOC129222963 [Uloborus diversus]
MNITIIIKKFILSTESSLQIYIVQFLCHLLLNSPLLENHITQLVNANITDLLFEVISTKNELLIESILCCLELFSHHSIFFEKNYALFGVPVLIDIAYFLSKLKNWRLFHKNLNLLTSMITSDKCLMSTDFLATHFQQSMQLIVKCVTVQNPSVLFTVCQFFQIFLKKENLPSPLPLTQILDTVSLCFRSLSKFLLSQSHASLSLKNASASSVPIELKVLASGLNLVSTCLR